MKKFLLGIVCLIFVGCAEPLLNSSEYVIVDTLEDNRNAFGMILSYDVVVMVKEDSSFHYGRVTNDGILVDINIKKVKNYYK
jgi:hypothetical protein